MKLRWGRTKARPEAPQCRPEKCPLEYGEESCRSAPASVGKTFKFTVEWLPTQSNYSSELKPASDPTSSSKRQGASNYSCIMKPSKPDEAFRTILKVAEQQFHWENAC